MLADIAIAGLIVAGIVIQIVMFAVILSFYKKCGPNEALIITGQVPEGMRIVIGGGTIVWPMINQKHSLSLEFITVSLVSAKPLFTANNETLQLEGKAQVKVIADEQGVARAAERFLNKPAEEISKVAQDVMRSHLRAFVATMTSEEVRAGREPLAQRIQEVSNADLAKMGLIVEFLSLEEIRGAGLS